MVVFISSTFYPIKQHGKDLLFNLAGICLSQSIPDATIHFNQPTTILCVSSSPISSFASIMKPRYLAKCYNFPLCLEYKTFSFPFWEDLMKFYLILEKKRIYGYNRFSLSVSISSFLSTMDLGTQNNFPHHHHHLCFC